MEGPMKRQLLWIVGVFLPFILGLFIWSCSERAPLEISDYSLPIPKKDQDYIFLRENLKEGGSFMPGYLSGRIRSDRIILEWDAYTAEDFLSYKIIRNGVAIKTILDATVTSYVDSGLVQDTYYNYKIGVYNRSGMARVDTIRLKTPKFLPPSDFDYRMVDSTTLTLYWKNNAESATGFRVYRRLARDTAYILVGTPSDTFFTDRGVQNGQAYYYQVEAFNDWESTPASFPYYVYVNYRMQAPYLYSAQQVWGTRSVRLVWRDNSNAEDGFRIYRRKSKETNFNVIATVPMNTTEYVDTDTLTALEYGATYEYAVTAYNAVEETPHSNIQSVTIIEQNIDSVEIGTGNIDWDYPFHTLYHDARTQILYLASEIGGPMIIRRIAFHVVKVPGQTMNNFVIRMKHTTISSYSSSNFDNSGYTICFNDSLTINNTGWVAIELTTPFQYDGTNNLIIDVSFNNSSYTWSGKSKATSTGVYRSITFRSDSGDGDDPLNYTSGTLKTYIPNIRLFTY